LLATQIASSCGFCFSLALGLGSGGGNDNYLIETAAAVFVRFPSAAKLAALRALKSHFKHFVERHDVTRTRQDDRYK